MGKIETDLEIFASLLLKITATDPGRAAYLERHVKFDMVSGKLIYSGNPLILKAVMNMVRVSDTD